MAIKYDDINGVFSYEKSFKTWLDDIFYSRASGDYVSRLRRFFKNYYVYKGETFDGRPIYKCLYKLNEEDIKLWLDDCLIQAATIDDPKNRSNIRSALIKFQDFLNRQILHPYDEDEIEDDAEAGDVTSSVTVKAADPGINEAELNRISPFINQNPVIFTRDEIKKKFLSQFRTEDRRLKIKDVDSGLSYPIKAMGPLINKESKERNKMTGFFTAHIDDIRILTGTGKNDSCRVKKIKQLILEEPDSDGLRQVWVETEDNKRLEVYTQTESGIVRMKVKSSSDINRDHDNAIANILKGLSEKNYPCLSIATQACKNVEEKKPTAIKAAIYDILKTKGTDRKEYAEGLYNDLEKLYKNLSFTLMEGRANRKKSASV